MRPAAAHSSCWTLLRLADAQPGDRVRVDRVELELWEYANSWMSSAGTDGLLDYEYVVTEPLSKSDPDENVSRARQLMPRVVKALLR